MQRLDHLRSAHWLTSLILVCLLAALLPAARPARAATPINVELESIADARVQGGSPDVGFGSGYLWVGTPHGHLAYVQFDLLALPADAVISSAELRLAFQGQYDGAANVELGRNDSAWDEAAVTWNTRPGSTFSGVTRPVGDDPATISWDATPVVQQWHSGSAPNYGFALRGDGLLKAFHSRETATPPVLAITYTVPEGEGQRPDLGDAPDSTNSLGVSPNTAYGGVAGNFPTVWAGTPAGEPAGPRHANPSFEGILGSALSREQEADSGNDADGVNNILDGGADNADNDRGDEGWRNRSIPLNHCEATTLRVRVSKGQNAQLSHMFLNVWFDGDHDGRWESRQLCTPEDEALQIPAYEWIVQDYFVDMSGIPAGGYIDIDVPTVTVLNTTPEQRHWMRFTLSEERAPQSASGHADGRGPHPDVGSYRYGETEDVLHSPPRPGEVGTLELAKRVVTDGEPVEWIDYVSYEIRLRHVGGTQAVQARISDVLPYPLIVYPTIDGGTVSYVVVTSPGGAAPLSAQLDVIPPSGGDPPQQIVTWQGTLAPDSEVVLTFQVRVLALCEPNQQTMTFVNRAEARPRRGPPIAAEDSFDAKCISYDEGADLTPVEIEDPIDPSVNQAPTSSMAALTLAPPATPLRLAIEAGDGSQRGLAETTCRTFIRFPGQSELNVLYDLWIDGAVDLAMVASVSPWTHAHADMPEGLHEIWFAPNPQTSPPQQSNSVLLNVNTSLPVDPITLTFTDSQGQSYHPPTLSWGQLKREVASHLRAGETYTVEITSCLANPSEQVDLTLPGGETISMTDGDGDGRYTGSFVFNPAEADSEATGELRVRGGAEQSFALTARPPKALAAAAT